MLTGQQLLGMNKSEIRTVCPEEGGKVFFQLQAVKSSIAVSEFAIICTHCAQLNAEHSNKSPCFLQLASEPSGMYNGRY